MFRKALDWDEGGVHAMETRKLIKFGKNSYVMSLPKEWVKQNKLSKGSVLYVAQEPGSISIAPSKLLVEQKSAYIPVENKSIADVEMELMAYYKANYSIFTFEGKELSELSKIFIMISVNKWF